MSELGKVLDAEATAVEEAEKSDGSPERTNVKVSRGHGRVKTLQIRLNEDELGELTALADDHGLPVSTVARQLLLQSLSQGDDLRSAFDRLERDISLVRRKALRA